MIAGPPRLPVPVPDAVRRVAAGGTARPVWLNEAGGLTFEVLGPQGHRFVKWAPAGSPVDLADERARLAWAAGRTPVPPLLGAGQDGDGSWLVTGALDGLSAVDPRWLAEPRTAVAAVGEGLRALHETLPVARCPFTWSAGQRVAAAHRRAAAGLHDPGGWDADHRHLTVDAALDLLDRVPPVDRAVVCHGDACAPNTLLGDDGRWCGHVDLGALGVADRWADLAVATWSTGWNYGPGWERLLLDAYGVPPDEERIRYYRLLWDLG